MELAAKDSTRSQRSNGPGGSTNIVIRLFYWPGISCSACLAWIVLVDRHILLQCGSSKRPFRAGVARGVKGKGGLSNVSIA